MFLLGKEFSGFLDNYATKSKQRYHIRNGHQSVKDTAIDGTGLAGVILAGHDGRRGYIYHLCVDSEFRRGGLARRLVESALDALEREGIQKAALVVFARNEGGNAFWEKIGFGVRNDLIYRNRSIHELERIDT